MNTQPTITFASGVGTVTGANFLVDADNKRILVDCGLVQGTKEQDLLNYDLFPYDPRTIDILIVTHSHLDHVGRIPKLVRAGFTGEIYSTQPTRRIAEEMLLDGVGIMASQAEHYGIEPMYDITDVNLTMSLWKQVHYHEMIPLSENVSFKLYDAGHILGSAQVMMFVGDTKVLFTGDLGNSPSPLLKDTEIPLEQPDYIVTESVYGDRNHEHRDERTSLLKTAYLDIIDRSGVLVIPAFSVERTQELLYELNDLIESGQVPKIPVFVDSPLGIAVTKIYETSIQYLNDDVQQRSQHDRVFDFPGLRFTESVEDSKAINEVKPPKVIIAGSGMSVGGRVVHHERRYLPDPSAMILMVGYQSPGTLGRRIMEGQRSVHMFGEDIPVRAEVRMITGYSGHKDSEHLQEYLSIIGKNAKQIFCAMGETGSSAFLAQRLRDWHGLPAVVPVQGQVVPISS